MPRDQDALRLVDHGARLQRVLQLADELLEPVPLVVLVDDRRDRGRQQLGDLGVDRLELPRHLRVGVDRAHGLVADLHRHGEHAYRRARPGQIPQPRPSRVDGQVRGADDLTLLPGKLAGPFPRPHLEPVQLLGQAAARRHPERIGGRADGHAHRVGCRQRLATDRGRVPQDALHPRPLLQRGQVPERGRQPERRPLPDLRHMAGQQRPDPAPFPRALVRLAGDARLDLDRVAVATAYGQRAQDRFATWATVQPVAEPAPVPGGDERLQRLPDRGQRRHPQQGAGSRVDLDDPAGRVGHHDGHRQRVQQPLPQLSLGEAAGQQLPDLVSLGGQLLAGDPQFLVRVVEVPNQRVHCRRLHRGRWPRVGRRSGSAFGHAALLPGVAAVMPLPGATPATVAGRPGRMASDRLDSVGQQGEGGAMRVGLGTHSGARS